jgi:hypothetical protein|tara:strand:- start:1249 stop:1521 length:273 start_codon:yes stop_codon:yes gene_type:complete
MEKNERIDNSMKEPLDKNKLGKGRKGPWDNETIKLIDEKSGELLLECKIGDKYHQAILEVGLNTILEELVNGNDWESKIDKEWTPLNEEV